MFATTFILWEDIILSALQHYRSFFVDFAEWYIEGSKTGDIRPPCMRTDLGQA